MRKPVTAESSCQPAVTLQLPLPLLSGLKAVRDGFFERCVRAGEQGPARLDGTRPHPSCAGRSGPAIPRGFAGDESAAAWGDVVTSLVARHIGRPVLAIIDGNPGLAAALRAAWPAIAIQRCTAHQIEMRRANLWKRAYHR